MQRCMDHFSPNVVLQQLSTADLRVLAAEHEISVLQPRAHLVEQLEAALSQEQPTEWHCSNLQARHLL